MKPHIFIVSTCAAVALAGCGSSSDKGSSATQAPTSAQATAASQVCSARADIQTQVKTLTSLSPSSATKGDVTSALTAIQADLQKMKDAQSELAPARKQQIQDAATAFGTQLKGILQQAIAGLATSDAQTQAKTAAASLQSAVKESLQPIQC